MKRKNKGKWKIIIFLSSAIALAVLFLTIQKISRDIFKFSPIYVWITTLSIIFPLFVLITFHKFLQCIFMLTIPQIISKRGRMFFIATAFLISFSGPTKNLIRNGVILSESMSCSQDQVRLALKNLADAAKEPYKMVKDMVSKILPVIKRNIERIKENLIQMKKSLEVVVTNIKKAFSWLENVVNVCNEKEGSPQEKCQSALESSAKSCREKFGPFSFLCETTKLVQMFCYILKPIEYFCEMIDFMSDEALQAIQKKFNDLAAKVEEMFYVTVDIDHKFDFQTNGSKEIGEIHTAINQEIQNRTSQALKFIDHVNFFLSFYFIMIYFKAYRFHNGYTSNLRYKNIFITKKFLKIDAERGDLGMETVIPLTPKERKYLIEMTSIKLAQHEWRHIFKSSVFLLFSTLHLCGILMADYSLFWIMTMIRYYGSRSAVTSKADESDVDLLSVNVSGHGIIAEFCQELVGIMRPLTKVSDINFLECLPNAEPPNYRKYKLISILIATSWIILIFEPYAMRLKNVIMEYYYPQRAEDRIVWLYHEIIRNRTGFIKFARQQLKQKIYSDGTDSSVTCLQILKAKFGRFWICRKIIGYNDKLSCLLCSKQAGNGDDLIRCETDGCMGIYCYECYNDLRNVCPLCRNLLNHTESTDDDEELGSSDEDLDETTSPSAKLLRNKHPRTS